MFRTIKTRIPPLYIVTTFVALVLVLLAFMLRISYSDVKLTHANGAVEAITLPLSRTSVGGPTVFAVDGHMSIGPLTPRTFRIIPDDRVLEIKINGAPVSLEGYTQEELGNWSIGFSIDLSPYLQTGDNTFFIRYSDLGAPGLTGMVIKNSASGWYWLVLLAVAVALAPLCIYPAKRSGVSNLQISMYVLIITGCIIRIATIFIYNPVNHIGSDAQRHWEAGIDVLRVDLMTMTDPIMYQLYMSWLAKLSLKIPELVAFYTSLLSIITPWLWYRFFRELQNSKTLALVGWAILALLPSWTSIYSYFMQETLLLPLLGAALWATWRARRKNTVAAFALMVVLWIMAGLTRGIAIPFAAVCCSWLWLLQTEKVKKALISSAILLLILGPLTYRSYQAVNQFAPHGMGHLAAIYSMSGKREILLHTRKGGASWSHIFGSPSTGAEPFYPFSDWRTQRTGRVVVSVDFNNGSTDWDKAYEALEFDLERFLWVTKENLIFLFFANSWPDNNMSRVVDQVNGAMRWIWAPATIAVLVFICLYRRRLKNEWMLPAVLLAWIVVQGLLPISVNEGRYRKPFEGLLLAQAVLLVAARRGYLRSWEVEPIKFLDKFWLHKPSTTKS
ncbi:hypothetical protein DWB84_13490 [Saccharophagus sp. K07]|uniref:glycosyltransferase family 39 protein n=1 Tax=Saccharophagus sp. K07 TaxID=2283636 RepID=UPI001651ECF3|nr:glycosyltransferase family 39 protein [Saccharophagus sp. K07]MBC6906470.1 hypothetical protein [Saccharophagus sp. K07]